MVKRKLQHPCFSIFQLFVLLFYFHPPYNHKVGDKLGAAKKSDISFLSWRWTDFIRSFFYNMLCFVEWRKDSESR